MIHGYSLYLNFDPDSDMTSTLGICGVGIYVSNTLSASQVYFNNNSFKDHVWIKLICKVKINCWWDPFIVALPRLCRQVYPHFVLYWKN